MTGSGLGAAVLQKDRRRALQIVDMFSDSPEVLLRDLQRVVTTHFWWLAGEIYMLQALFGLGPGLADWKINMLGYPLYGPPKKSRYKVLRSLVCDLLELKTDTQHIACIAAAAPVGASECSSLGDKLFSVCRKWSDAGEALGFFEILYRKILFSSCEYAAATARMFRPLAASSDPAVTYAALGAGSLIILQGNFSRAYVDCRLEFGREERKHRVSFELLLPEDVSSVHGEEEVLEIRL